MKSPLPWNNGKVKPNRSWNFDWIACTVVPLSFFTGMTESAGERAFGSDPYVDRIPENDCESRTTKDLLNVLTSFSPNAKTGTRSALCRTTYMGDDTLV